MRVISKIILFVLLSTYIAGAGNALTSSFEFLRTDFSPRLAAMGGSSLTLRGDIGSVFVNPAGAASIATQQFVSNYTNYLLDINGGQMAYARPMPGIGVLTAAILYMDYGEFDETDEYAVFNGRTFSARDLALSVGLSGKLDENIAYGVNLKYIYSSIQDYNASAVGLDFGLLYAAPFEDNLFFALNLLNVGSNFKYYDTQKEPLPLSIGIGFSKKLAHLPLEINGSLRDLNVESEKLADRLKRFSLGGEFTVSEMLRLRLGYNHDLHNNLQVTTENKFSGISAGLGILWKNYRFDYSYSNYGFLGNIHRFGIWGTL